MAKKLCERIFEYGEAQGYWKPGDVIIDPFGGIGSTGLIGSYRGYRVVSIELEPRFVEMQQANIEKNRKKLERLCKPIPVVIQGDARNLSKYIVISDAIRWARAYNEVNNADPSNEVIGSIFFPPYADGSAHTGGDDPHPEHMTGGRFVGVGLNGAISSPPYEHQEMSGTRRALEEYDRTGSHAEREYGDTDGQIGAESGETYWQAMRQVYGELYKVLRPGGVAAIVVKDFVRNRQNTGMVKTITIQELSAVLSI